MSLTRNDEFLAAEYTLGLLDPKDTAQAHALLASSDEAVASALKWEERFLALTDLLPPAAPPSDLLLKIQTTLGHDTTVPLRPSAPPTQALEPPPPKAAAQHTIKTGDEVANAPPATTAAAVPQAVRPAPPPSNAASSSTRRGRRQGFWSGSRPWQALSVLLAVSLLALYAAGNPPTAESVPTPSPANEEKPATAAPAGRFAVLQAPGQTSTPGWLLAVDPLGNLSLSPKVSIDIPPDSAVYLWTRNDAEPVPRLLGGLNPGGPATVPAEVAGNLHADQLFEMTLEPRSDTPPSAPKGPILFIGRLVQLDRTPPTPSEPATPRP